MIRRLTIISVSVSGPATAEAGTGTGAGIEEGIAIVGETGTVTEEPDADVSNECQLNITPANPLGHCIRKVRLSADCIHTGWVLLVKPQPPSHSLIAPPALQCPG